jgi:hypothetical protein
MADVQQIGDLAFSGWHEIHANFGESGYEFNIGCSKGFSKRSGSARSAFE